MNEQDPLDQLLDSWKAPEPSPSLDARVRAGFAAKHPSFWRRMWSMRISIPAPVFALALLVISIAAFWQWRPSATPAPLPAAPQGGYLTRVEAAGFQPLPDGDVRIIRTSSK